MFHKCRSCQQLTLAVINPAFLYNSCHSVFVLSSIITIQLCGHVVRRTVRIGFIKQGLKQQQATAQLKLHALYHKTLSSQLNSMHDKNAMQVTTHAISLSFTPIQLNQSQHYTQLSTEDTSSVCCSTKVYDDKLKLNNRDETLLCHITRSS